MITVEAIYERGLLRPLKPLDLPEGAQVSVSLTGNGMPVNAPPPFTARELTGWMQRRGAAGRLLDEAALDRLDAAQAPPVGASPPERPAPDNQGDIVRPD